MHFHHLILLPPEAADWPAAEIDRHCTEAMQPFDESLEVAPYKARLDADEVTLMAQHYGLDPGDHMGLAAHMVEWNESIGGVDEHGLYHWSQQNPQGKWDWWRIGGRWDGEVRGIDALPDSNGFNYGPAYQTVSRNVCRVRDLPPDAACWSLLLPDPAAAGPHGQQADHWTWHEEGWAYRLCASWEEYHTLSDEQRRALQAQVEREWKARCAELLNAFPNHLAVSCDIHR